MYGFISGKFTSDTNVKLQSNSGGDTYVRVYVVEWEGAHVQSGELQWDGTVQGSGNADVTVDEVDLSKTFVIFNQRMQNFDTNPGIVFNRVYLTTTTNLHFHKMLYYGSGQHGTNVWFVIEHPNIRVFSAQATEDTAEFDWYLSGGPDLDHTFAAVSEVGNAAQNTNANLYLHDGYNSHEVGEYYTLPFFWARRSNDANYFYPSCFVVEATESKPIGDVGSVVTKTETLTLEESSSELLLKLRNLADTLSISSESFSIDSTKKLIETCVLIESVAKEVGFSLSDAISFIENVVVMTGLYVNLNDSEALSEMKVLSQQVNLSLDDTIALAEAIQKILSLPLAETLFLVDSFSKYRGASLIQNVALAESVLKTFQANRNISESTELIDSINAYIPREKSLADVVSFLETLQKGLAMMKSENINFAEERNVDASKQLTDNVQISPKEFDVQSGSETLNPGVATATINLATPVPVGRSFPIVSVRSDNYRTSRTLATATLQNEVDGYYTQLYIRRSYTTDTTAIYCWQVITGRNFTVQTFEKTLTADTEDNQSVSEVDLSKAFLLITMRTSFTGVLGGLVGAKFTSTTNVNLMRGSGGSETVVRVYVVEWEGAYVQSGEKQWTGSVQNMDETINRIDTTKSFVLFNQRMQNYDTNPGIIFGRLYITSPTNLHFHKWLYYSSGDHGTFNWFVIQHPSINVKSAVGSSTTGTESSWYLSTTPDLDHSFAPTSLIGHAGNNTNANTSLQYAYNTHEMSVLVPGVEMHYVRRSASNSPYSMYPSSFMVEASGEKPTKEVDKIKSESVAVIETKIKQILKALADLEILSDAFSRQTTTSKSLTEILTMSESIRKEFGLTQEETLSLLESASNILVYNRSRLENVNLSDEMSRTLVFERAIADSFVLSEILLKRNGLSFADSLALSEFLLRQYDFSRSLTDAVLLTEAIQKSTGLKTQDAVSFLEQLQKTLGKQQEDNVSLAEILTRNTNKTLSDSIAIIESLRKILAKRTTETLFITEAIQLNTGKTLTDAFTLAEFLQSTKFFDQHLSDVESLAETMSKSTGKSLNETLSFLESLRKDYAFFLSDVLPLVESQSSSVLKKLLDSIALIQSGTPSRDVFLDIPVNLTLIDLLARESSEHLSDVVNFADLLIPTFSASRKFADSVSLIESVQKSTTLSKNDSVALVDSVSRIVESKKALSDSFALIESYAPVVVFERTLSEVLTLAELISKQSGLQLIDSFDFIEVMQRTSGSTKALFDSESFIESLTKTANISKSEALDILESIIKTSSTFKILSDTAWINRLGGSLSFDGIDDYVDAGNAASLDITDAITLEAWAKDPVFTNELTSLRTENSKTFRVANNKNRLETSMGAIHYKDDYKNSNEEWKDIDLTWKNNKITKAPYELTRNGNKATIRDKKTGEISSIELLESNSSEFEIIPETNKISFRHSISSSDLPFEAKFKVTGKIPFATRAFDEEGTHEIETTLKNGILTERLEKLSRKAKGEIKIDPTWQVGQSTDDANRRLDPWFFSLIFANVWAGAHSTASRYGSGMRFTNITIPKGATISDGTHLHLRAYASYAGGVVRTRISAENVDDADTFLDDADVFDSRWANRTLTRVDWDDIPEWTTNLEYDSPEIKTVIKEIVDREGWVSGNDIMIFWEDFDDRSDHVVAARRAGYSYDGSSTYAPKLIIEYVEPGANKQIINKGHDAYSLEMTDTGTSLKGYINNVEISTTIATPLQWHHYVLTYDGAYQRLFIDGILKNSSLLSGAINTNATVLKMGDLFSGNIDEVRVYNRALSSNEIFQHYQGIFQNETGLRGLWNMDAGSGDLVADSSGQGNNGTRYGATWSQEGAPKILNHSSAVGSSRSDSLSMSETLEKEFIKKNIDSLIIADVYKTLTNKILSDDVLLSEVKATRSETFKALASSLILTETLSKTTGVSLSDSFSFIDIFTRAFASERSLSDSVTLAEILNTLSSYKKTLTEVLAIAESITQNQRLPLKDSLIIVENILTTSVISRSFTDSVELLENIIKMFDSRQSTEFGLTDLSIKNIALSRNEQISFVEALIKSLNLNRFEALTILESFIKIQEINKQETIQISEGIKRIFSLQNADLIVFSEALSKEATKQKVENISFVDSMSSRSIFQRSLNESLLLDENISILVPKYLTITDLLALSETIKKGMTIPHGEILIISEEDVKELDKSIFETFNIDENIREENIYGVDLVDQVSLVETLSKQYGVSFSDALALADSIRLYESEPLGEFTPLMTKSKRGKTILLTK
ncbi:MAG: LamG domain-containing protein [Methanogenium sp.]